MQYAGITGITWSKLITYVINHLEWEELADLADEGLSDLFNVQDIIGKVQVATNLDEYENTDQIDEQDNLQKKVEALRLSLQEKENTLHGLVSTNTNPLPECSTPVKSMPKAHPNCNMWCKDFKISDQIGKPGQKDRLTFSSLARQIESGPSKDYPESENINEVICAITPGLQLSSYFEGKGKLKLPALRRILRCYYQEKGATELYKQLTSEAQSSKETPQGFLIRVMDRKSYLPLRKPIQTWNMTQH